VSVGYGEGEGQEQEIRWLFAVVCRVTASGIGEIRNAVSVRRYCIKGVSVSPRHSAVMKTLLSAPGCHGAGVHCLAVLVHQADSIRERQVALVAKNHCRALKKDRDVAVELPTNQDPSIPVSASALALVHLPQLT